MPTATKSTRLKTSVKNKKDSVPEISPEESILGDLEGGPGKIKKPLEIDELEPVVGSEEKLEEDPLIAPIEEEEGVGEEISLDSEELNPFGDRWEE